MGVMVLTVLVASAPPTGFTTAVERIALVKTAPTITVKVDSLTAHITLKGAKLATASGHGLCPKAETKHGALVLTCVTRRVWASVETDTTGPYLDVRELRGVVPGDNSLLLRPWPLQALSIPDVCPGVQPGPRGECALIDGHTDRAKEAFLEALGGADTNLARVRLGDLALKDGDLEEALSRYSKVSFAGPIGRMAKARACDLTGGCFTGLDSDDVEDTSGLPEPLKTEFELYMLRRQVTGGRVAVAMNYLAHRITREPSLCEGAVALCQHLVIAGLEESDEQTRVNALSTYMSDEVRYGPLTSELALAAGAAAEQLGAPAFAAAVMSSVSQAIPASELDAHLLKVAELFLNGRDRVRTGFILEYADSRLGRRTGKAWQAIRQSVAFTPPSTVAAIERRMPDVTKLSAEVELSTELARAAALRSRAVSQRTQENNP